LSYTDQDKVRIDDQQFLGETTPLCDQWLIEIYEACPEIKDTKVLNMHNIFNLQKRHCERIACI
jgi:hypothetical protein